MTLITKLLIFIGISLPLVACDQVTKVAARRALEGRGGVPLLDGLLHFQLVENPGAFLSMGATMPETWRQVFFLIALPLGLLLMALVMILSSGSSRIVLCALSLIIGGGIGNLLDRIFNHGAVVDFVSIEAFGLRTGIFNLADVAIVAGGMLLVFEILLESRTANRYSV